MPSFASDPFTYLRQRAIRGGGSGGAVVAPVLGPLTLTPNTASLNSPYSGTVTGKSAGSTLSLSGPGAVGLSVVGAAVSGTPTVLGAVNIIETPLVGLPFVTNGVLTVTDGVAPLAFPAQGAGYDFDWTNKLDPVAPYRTIAPNTGSQPLESNVMPLLYRQMITQVPHYIENEDGSLKLTPATSPRRSNKGLFSYNGQWNRVAAPRNLTAANWTKTNATVSKDQIGRDGVTNTGCLLTFTADGGSISQAITIATGPPRRVLFDIKRVSGADPIEWSIDGGATWTSYTLKGDRWGGWDRVRGPIHTSENPTIVLRGKAGNSYVTDFIHLSEVRDWPSLDSQIHDTHRMDPNTGVGKDRIHHTDTTNGGGPSGEQGINLLRSKNSHGMFTEFTYMTANAIMAVLGGYQINTFISPPTIVVQNQQAAAGQEILTVPARLDDGSATAWNKLMYFRTPSELRVAINGVLYRMNNMTTMGTAITHDFATNGSGAALEGIVRRLVWFDDVRVPTDAEMIAWTAL